MRLPLYPLPWRVTAAGVELSVHLQPRATLNRIVGLHGNTMKIALTAPPVDGAANAALLRFLASQLDIPLSSVSLLKGTKSRHKQLLLHTTEVERIVQGLAALVQRVDKKNRDD